METLAPGFALARGVWRQLETLGMTAIPEFVPTRGLRVDLIALTPKGEIWIIECKSCLTDFQNDQKWDRYLEWCDRFFWAVDSEFPEHVLPDETGLIRADRHDAAIIRDAPLNKLPAARRKAITLKFAQTASRRLHYYIDPTNAL